MVIVMERHFKCPSCAATNAVTNPGILMRICDYCRTAMYWDKESVLRAGRQSVDLPPSTRFKVGGSGKLKGSAFRVLGRLSYAHEDGTWNEWFIEMQDGTIMWLTEDEGELFLESPVSLSTTIPPFEALAVGMQIPLDDKVGIVEELGSARCLGGEGQIPFEVEVGETYPYADGSTPDGKTSFGLEYDTLGQNPQAFVGRILAVKQDRTRREDRGTATEGAGEIVRCVACGKPYEGPRVKTTTMVVCDSCGTALELDEAETRVVGQNVGKTPVFTFRIGLPITIEGIRYEVMGRLLYVEIDDQIPDTSFDYVLYNPENGYAFLSEYRGHFTVARVTHGRVEIPSPPSAKKRVQVGSDAFKVFESGEVTLKWVDGAIPWKATVGETTRYTHLVKPPEFVDEEIKGKERELFRGRYLTREELATAIPDEVDLPDPRGVYSCQPYEPSHWLQGLGRIAAIFAALNVVLFLDSLIADKNTLVLQETITAEQYAQEHLTGPFQVSHDGAICRLRGKSPLKNSWLAVDFAVVDASDRVISEFSGDASYYYGTDSDGSWTEGSRSFSSYFKVKKAGTYRLLLRGQGGSGYNGPAGKEPLQIMVTTDNTMSWYFVFPLIMCGLMAMLQPCLRYLFELRRWAPVTKGSADDSDD
jgi:hypothetical protein